MKIKNLLIMTVLLATTAFAQELPGKEVVPEYMKGGTITVTLKDGKSYTYSTDEYKVVRRNSTVAKTVRWSEDSKFEPKQSKKNRVLVNAGAGVSGNQVTVTGNSVTIKDKVNPVFGLTYVRDLNDTLSVSGSVLTNGTTTVGAGLQY